MTIAILPRPGVLTSLVVAGSLASGLAFGLLAAGIAMAASRIGRG